LVKQACSECGTQHHEICKLYNSYGKEAYRCELCCNVAAPGGGGPPPPKPTPSPRDLPECALSRVLEKEIASSVPLVGDRVCIRIVNQELTTCEMKPLLRERFPEHVGGYPYVQKYILCFMDIQGRPVCFFAIIVHECGSDSPQPNTDRVYISLLDSIKLPKQMLPSHYRTRIYHNVLRAYLRQAGNRGFKHCHIYTCPPRKGQNYIFPFKPEDQKEINTVRLRKWCAHVCSQAPCLPYSVVCFYCIQGGGGGVYLEVAL
jgi:hypothetical protein